MRINDPATESRGTVRASQGTRPGRVRKKLFSRECNVCLHALVFRIKGRVLTDPLEWLLELRDRKHDPAIRLRSLPQVSGQQPLSPIFVSKVKHDRRRFRNNEVASTSTGPSPPD